MPSNKGKCHSYVIMSHYFQLALLWNRNHLAFWKFKYFAGTDFLMRVYLFKTSLEFQQYNQQSSFQS